MGHKGGRRNATCLMTPIRADPNPKHLEAPPDVWGRAGLAPKELQRMAGPPRPLARRGFHVCLACRLRALFSPRSLAGRRTSATAAPRRSSSASVSAASAGAVSGGAPGARRSPETAPPTVGPAAAFSPSSPPPPQMLLYDNILSTSDSKYKLVITNKKHL